MIKAIIFDLWNVVLTRGFSVNRALQKQFNIANYPDYRKMCEGLEMHEWESIEELSKGFLDCFDITHGRKHKNRY